MPNNQYEWFKGPQAQGKGSNWKGNLKTTWKFTRIFLFFSLFFFSMWGCVQTFTNKTDTKIGKGVEISSSRDTVSPQITEINVTTKIAKNGTQVDPAKSIYTFKADQYNKVLYNEDNATFDKMRESYNQKFGRTFYLDEAIKGGNSVVRLTNNDSKSTLNGKYLTGPSDKAGEDLPLVATTIFDELKGKPIDEKYIDDYAKNFLTNLKYTSYKLEGDTKLTITTQTANLFNNLKIEKWNQVYNLNILANILKDYESVMGQKFENTIPASGVITDKDKILEKVIELQNIQMLEQSLIALAFKPADGVEKIEWNWTPADFEKKIILAESGYVFNTSQNYKPIATWGQAWEMGRGSGPFYGIFVYPIAWVTDKITNAFPIMQGWESFLSIVFVVVIISMITFSLSFKGTLQQQRMTELNSKKAIIEAKYEGYKGNKQMENRKRQEVSELYKKEGINPLSSLGTIFITMPFFLAMWRTIGTNQHIKATVWLGINFAETSWRQLFAGHAVYLPLLVIAGGTNILSQLYPRWLTKRRDKNRINVHQKAAMKKGNKTQNIMMIAFTFITLIFTAGLQVYFIVRSIWRIGESTLTHRILIRQKQKRIQLRK